MAVSTRKKRLPLLFYSYLTAEMLAPFFASFIIMNGVFFLVKLIPFLNIVLELNIGFADFVRLFSYLFPNMFLYSIPMAAMLGITIGFSRLANDTEILAFKASGIGIYHTLPPLVIISVVLAAITGYFSIILIPAGDTAMQQMMYQLAREKIDKGIKDHTFTEALGDLVVYVDEIDKETGQWNRVWVSDMREREIPAITMARSGTMQADIEQMLVTLILRDGSMHIPEEQSAQTITFDTYVVNIPIHPLSSAPQRRTRGTMTMPELIEKADEFGRTTPKGLVYHTEFHKRLVLPVGCLVLSLLGMPLGLQAGPGRRAIGIPLGLVLYIVYYVLFSLARNLSTSGNVPVLVGMWFPNVLFFLLVVVFIQRVANERTLVPVVVSEALHRANTMAARFANFLLQCLTPGGKRFSPERKGAVESPPASVKKAKLRGNVKSRVFHFPECDYYYCKNCSIEFKNVTVALQAGFEPCRFCRTIMPEAEQVEP